MRAADWVIPVDEPGTIDLRRWFGRTAPLVVEIGSGVGEATTALALQRPDVDVLALEVWRPGVAATLRRLDRAAVGNVRLLAADAVWVMDALLPAASVTEVWTFFPDPWPKTRHRKRRLVGSSMAALVGDRLVPGGAWRLATDWADYAAQMRDVLDAEPTLVGGVSERWEARPLTRFERRGLAQGRDPIDLTYRRR